MIRHRAIVGMQRDTLFMAALRAAVLLDRDETTVSFQAIHHLLKKPNVEAGLLQALETVAGRMICCADLINEFRQTYQEIDWKAHGRLVHLRNLGIAHLTRGQMSKSVTLKELRTIIRIIGRLATTLRKLCQSQIVFHDGTPEKYRDLAKRVIR
jgi:hypothetical protein